MSDAIFIPEGALLVPTELAIGPWDPHALHGGGPAALLVRAIEAMEPRGAMHLARITAEFLRPIPLAPLLVEAEVVRPGRKVQLVRSSIHAGGVEVARATGLRIRRSEVPLPPDLPVDRATPPLPETGQAPSSLEGSGPGFFQAFEYRLVGGSVEGAGPATLWFRLRVPVVMGEDPSPVMRAVAAADFGNGISRVLDFSSHIFINPDLTVYLHREPVGEWVCLSAQSQIEEQGVGLAASTLFDRDGPIGRSLQALLVEAR